MHVARCHPDLASTKKGEGTCSLLVWCHGRANCWRLKKCNQCGSSLFVSMISSRCSPYKKQMVGTAINMTFISDKKNMTPDNWRYLILQPNQTIGHSKLLMLITGSLPNQSYTHGCVCITVHVSLYNIVVHQCKLPVTKLFLNNFHLKYTEKTYLGSSSFFSRERVHIPPKREKGNYPLKSAFFEGDMLLSWRVHPRNST